MKVIINDKVYVPASKNNADETAKAIIRAMISGYYTQLDCHVEGNGVRKGCDCPACHLHRIAVHFLGDYKSGEETDPGFVELWKATE